MKITPHPPPGQHKGQPHSQHTLGGWSPLLWTLEADGHLGLFSTWSLVWRNAWTPHGWPAGKKGHHLPSKGHLSKECGISHAFHYFHKSVRTQRSSNPHLTVIKDISAATMSDNWILRKQSLERFLLNWRVKHPFDWWLRRKHRSFMFSIKPLAKEEKKI